MCEALRWGTRKALSMTTVSELVEKGDIPEERKDNVKRVLHDLGYAASRAVGKAFLKITEKHMTDAGMSIADANAILAEVEPLQGEGQPFTKVIQDLRDEMQLLRSELAARNTEAKSIAFSSVSGAAANQLLEDLHLTEADGFEEAPFETPAGVSDIDTFDFSQFVDEDAGTPSFVEYHHQQLQACGVHMGRNKATFRMNHSDVLQAEVTAPRQYSFKEGCTPTQAYHEMADFLLKQGTMLTSKQTIPEPPAELEEKLCRPIKKLKGLVQGYSAM
ncbi:hypothetical protein WJX79_007412 [Trebouxia sp. C0005]